MLLVNCSFNLKLKSQSIRKTNYFLNYAAEQMQTKKILFLDVALTQLYLIQGHQCTDTLLVDMPSVLIYLGDNIRGIIFKRHFTVTFECQNKTISTIDLLIKKQISLFNQKIPLLYLR